MSHDPARIQFELPGDEAWALAQFVNQSGFRLAVKWALRSASQTSASCRR